jgi:hypothetical protein
MRAVHERVRPTDDLACAVPAIALSFVHDVVATQFCGGQRRHCAASACRTFEAIAFATAAVRHALAATPDRLPDGGLTLV